MCVALSGEKAAPGAALAFSFGMPAPVSAPAATVEPPKSAAPAPAPFAGLAPPAPAPAAASAPAFSFGGKPTAPTDLAVIEIAKKVGATLPPKPVRVFRFGLPPGSPPSSPDTARRSPEVRPLRLHQPPAVH